MFIALGTNKQLDLTALTEPGRLLAMKQGRYANRQIVQLWFIASVEVVCICIAAILLWLAHEAPTSTWLALIGTVAGLAFVLIRAASFHHIDASWASAFLD